MLSTGSGTNRNGNANQNLKSLTGLVGFLTLQRGWNLEFHPGFRQEMEIMEM